MNQRSRLLACVLAAAVFSAGAGLAAPSAELVAGVQAVFERSCAQCHGPQLARPKAKFGFVTDLARLAADSDFVTPGKPDESAIFTVLVSTDADELMPPPDSDAPPLTPAEIDSVRQWVLALADAGKTGTSAGTEAGAASVATTPTPGPSPNALTSPTPGEGPVAERRWTLKVLVARFHPLVVHFPIALLVAAFLAEIYAALRRRPALGEATVWCLGIGALGSVAAVVTGWLDAPVAGHSDASVFAHRWTGVATMFVAFVAWGLVLRARKRSRAWVWVAWAVLLGLAILVSLTGHLGGALVYGDDYLPF